MPDIKPALPNFLLIHSDQHRFDCLGVNGHPLLKTPVLDRLAAEGMNFTHAFTPIPLCVPLIARWPGRIRAGSACDAFVCHALDLAATFVAAANAPVPGQFQGQSLLPLFDGAADNGRSDIFAMYHGNQFGLYSQRMVRDRCWKYVWNATAQDELYDLQADPGEITNLAAQPGARDELRRLRQRAVAWMEAVNDPLLNPWTRAQLLEGLKV